MLSKFKTNILLHLAGILIVVFTGAGVWNISHNWPLLLVLLAVLAGLLVSLYSLIAATNKKLAHFLLNIRYEDFEAGYSATQGEPSERELSSAFNLITDKFRSIRQQKEAQFQYLNAIVENVDTGLICFDENGRTVLMNRSLQQLLHKSYFRDKSTVQHFNSELHDALERIEPGEKKLVRLVINNQLLQLAVRKTILKTGDEVLHLFAIQNIHTELEGQELDAWQKLIRILTHEILNSVTPVVSLSETAHQMIRSETGYDAGMLEKSIEAVWRRSKGLLHFTETYRRLTRIPQPVFEPSKPVEILERVLVLLSKELKESEMEVRRYFPAHEITVLLDPALMEQVFINLVKNALQAMQDTSSPRLTLAVTKDAAGRVEISVADNGPGIPDEVLSQIFVPFFTTKEEGSGIGLSLCRQIVHLHKGQIHVASAQDKGACFTVTL
ncbi:MAG TPA: ATP-binding protein [Saprospiraceae bacterium]|nr:ATP-binding protein [Saprospiraceae bacterium]